MTFSCLIPLLLWTFLQLFPLSGPISGPLFLISLGLTALASAPYRTAKKMKNSPLHILLMKEGLFLIQGNQKWHFNTEQIENIQYYSYGPIYGMRLNSAGILYKWPFVENSVINKLKQTTSQLAVDHEGE